VSSIEIYYFGIIDVLTEYNCSKRLEYISKMIFYCIKKMIFVPPDFYQKRFLEYLSERFGTYPNLEK